MAKHDGGDVFTADEKKLLQDAVRELVKESLAGFRQKDVSKKVRK
jgi:hypothetical protein